MRFREFIGETAISQPPHYSALTNIAELVNAFRENCSDAEWMVDEPCTFFRGDGHVRRPFTIGDPSPGRKSSNTTNHYTVLLDNLPSFQDYPKRSRSFICSTDVYKATEYSGSWSLYRVIPFNGVKIGICPTGDIWDVDTGFSRPLEQFSDLAFLQHFVNDTWDSFLDAAQELKSGNNEVLDDLANVLAGASGGRVDDIKNDFIGFLDEYINPRLCGFSLATTKNERLIKNHPENEVWIGGKCLLINDEIWDEFREYIKFGT